MGKKKKSKQTEKQTTVNNIEQLNLEIDYDKLAEAIVKANNNSKKKKDKIRTSAMRFFNGMTFAMIYVIAFLGLYATWSEAYSKNNAPLIECIILSVAFLVIGVYSFLCQQETFDDNESDTVEFFNTNISLVALIVALIALFKGVG